MKKKPNFILFSLPILLSLASCGLEGTLPSTTSSVSSSESIISGTSTTSFPQEDSSSLQGTETPSTSSSITSIEEDIAEVKFAYDLSSLEDNTVITLTEAGNYELYGTAANAAFIIQSEGEIILTLNNANLTYLGDSAPISVTTASKFTLYLKQGTSNTITDSASNTLDAVINVKKTNCIIDGTGSLTLNSNGIISDTIESGKGIHTSKILKILNGSITVNNAVDHAFSGKDGFEMYDGSLVALNVKGDGIHSKSGEANIYGGSIDFNVTSDGIDAAGLVNIEKGNINIHTEAEFVLYKSSDDVDGTLLEDARYVKSGNSYKKISSEDALRTSTKYYMASSAKGIKSDIGINILDGTFNINSSDDSIHSDGDVKIYNGSYTLKSIDDGIHSDTFLQIGGSEITSRTSSFVINIEECYEGLEGTSIEIYDGDININALDDGINAAGGSDSTTAVTEEMYIHIAGDCYIKVSSVGDSLDANGNISMYSGTVYVFGPTGSGDGALDYDGNFYITGGTLVVVGSTGMIQMPDNPTQNVMGVTCSSSLSQNSIIYLGNEDFQVAVKLPKAYSSLAFIVSSPLLTTGSTYSVRYNVTYAYEFIDNVSINNGSTTTGTSLCSLTISNVITTYGSLGIGGSGSGGTTGTPGSGGSSSGEGGAPGGRPGGR